MSGSPCAPQIALGAAMTRILVVDDEPDLADFLGILFDAMGHDARVAYHGQHALTIAKTFDPHIIFLDLNMPVMDGYAAAQSIRGSGDSPSPFLIALSGLDGADVERATKAAGFDLYLTKPADTNALLALVQNLSGRTREATS
jgi:CheY-like chemotaxis protein